MSEKQNNNNITNSLNYCPLCHKTNCLPGLIGSDNTPSPSPLIICTNCSNIKFDQNNTNLDENKLLNLPLPPQFPYPDKLDQYYIDINKNPVPEWIANDKQIEHWYFEWCKWDDQFNSDNYYYSNK